MEPKDEGHFVAGGMVWQDDQRPAGSEGQRSGAYQGIGLLFGQLHQGGQ
jgi:hypothetical protein